MFVGYRVRPQFNTEKAGAHCNPRTSMGKCSAANGSAINILGHMTINFSIRGEPLHADLLIADDVDEFMLGFDWLTAQKAKWDFDAKTLTLHGHTIDMNMI